MNVIRQFMHLIVFSLLFGFSVWSSANESPCDALYEQIMKPGFDDAAAGRRVAECYEQGLQKDSRDQGGDAEAYYRIGVARYFTAASSGDIAEMEKSRDALQKAVDLDSEHAAARDQLMKAEGWINP